MIVAGCGTKSGPKSARLPPETTTPALRVAEGGRRRALVGKRRLSGAAAAADQREPAERAGKQRQGGGHGHLGVAIVDVNLAEIG